MQALKFEMANFKMSSDIPRNKVMAIYDVIDGLLKEIEHVEHGIMPSMTFRNEGYMP